MKSLRWRSVSGGIVALATIIALVVLILIYARSGALHGGRFRLFVAAPDASNLRTGSEVWLNGQRVGIVRAIRFNEAATPVKERIVIELDVLSAVQHRIRIDSRASLQSGGTVIGEPVVYIAAGSRGARRVTENDTLRAMGNPDLEIAASRVTESLEHLPALIAGGREILANARAAGTRAQEVVGRGIGNQSLSRNTSALMAKLSAHGGSVGRMLADSSLHIEATRSLAAVDTVRALLATSATALGRFRRDSSLARSVGELRSDIARLRDMATSSAGTVGRVQADSAIRYGLDSAFVELNALIADIKKHPLRYAGMS